MSAAAGQGRAAAEAAPADGQLPPPVAARDWRSPDAAQPRDARAAAAAQRLPACADTDPPGPASRTSAAHSSAADSTRGTRAASAPLQLRIDRLIIDGLPHMAGGERALRAALLQELQRLFGARPPALAQGGALARLPALELALPAAADAASVGRELARALHRSLGA